MPGPLTGPILKKLVEQRPPLVPPPEDKSTIGPTEPSPQFPPEIGNGDLIVIDAYGRIVKVYRGADPEEGQYRRMNSPYQIFHDIDFIKARVDEGEQLVEVPIHKGVRFTDILEWAEGTLRGLSSDRMTELFDSYHNWVNTGVFTINNPANDRPIVSNIDKTVGQFETQTKEDLAALTSDLFPEWVTADTKFDMSTDAIGTVQNASNKFLNAYFQDNYGRPMDTPDAGHPLALAMDELLSAWENGESIDELRANKDLAPFIDIMEPRIIPGTGEPPPEGMEPEAVTNFRLAAQTINKFIRDMQVAHGMSKGRKLAEDILTRYREEFKPPTISIPTVDKDTMDKIMAEFPNAFPFILSGPVPNLFDISGDELTRFLTWANKEEAAYLDTLSEADKAKVRENNLADLQAEYNSKYPGTLGQQLFKLALDTATRQGIDLTTIEQRQSFPLPEAVFNSLMPSGAKQLAILAGVTPEHLMERAGITTAEETGVRVNQMAIQMAQDALTTKALSPEIQEGIRTNINDLLAQLPPPTVGPRKFYLPEVSTVTSTGVEIKGAQDIFREWLIQQGMQPGASPYGSAAWSYAPQLWKHFTSGQQRAVPGGEEPFREFLNKLGPTFFARLTPKKERKGAPKTIRPPGGGRLPLA